MLLFAPTLLSSFNFPSTPNLEDAPIAVINQWGTAEMAINSVNETIDSIVLWRRYFTSRMRRNEQELCLLH